MLHLCMCLNMMFCCDREPKEMQKRQHENRHMDEDLFFMLFIMYKVEENLKPKLTKCSGGDWGNQSGESNKQSDHNWLND